jgi:membrane-bound ClpP family serine protease
VRHLLAYLIDVVVAIVAVLILAGIVLVVLEASRDNSFVSAMLDIAKFLAGPFDGMFEPSNRRLGVAVNWGIAIAVYVFAGRWVTGRLRR